MIRRLVHVKKIGWSVMSVLCCLLMSCSQSNKKGLSGQTVLRIGGLQDLEPLNPILSVLGTASSLVSVVSDGLVKDFRGENLLAQSIESADAKVWKIKIRDNVYFHDGTLLKARDVLHSFNLVRTKSNRAIHRDHFNLIETIREVTPREIEVVLSEPCIPFRSYLSFGILPHHLFPLNEFNETSFLKNPVGTGPFRLVSYQGKMVRFERYDRYFQGIPKISAIEVLQYPTKEEAWMAFVQKHVDIVLDPFTDTEHLPRFSQSLIEQKVSPPYGYFLSLSVESFPLSDLQVRKAISFAINRKHLLTFAKNLNGPGPEWLLSSTRSKVIPFDVKEAQTILEKAGWKIYPKEVVRRNGKQRLSFELRYFSFDEISWRIARAISRDLFNVGIETRLVPGSIKDIFSHMNKKKAGAVISFYPPYSDPDRLRDYFHSSMLSEGYNLSHFSDKWVDKLLMNGRKETDPEQRMGIYQKVLERIQEQAPAIFLFWRHSIVPMDKCWKNVSILSGNFLGSVWKWHCIENHET